MKLEFKEYTTQSGEILLYIGHPNLRQLEDLSKGVGDIWHSSLYQGYRNIFPEIVYQTATFWYINDFENLDECVNWRINPDAFVVRKSVWDFYDGFENCYESDTMKALDFGYNSLCYRGVVPLFIKDLFPVTSNSIITIPVSDIFAFYFRNFKSSHAKYALFRMGFWNPKVISAYLNARKLIELKVSEKLFPPRKLSEIQGNPTVSYIIPTMLRQEFTLNLLEDLKNQSYQPTQVIVVDATSSEKRDASLYNPNDYPFEVQFIWQVSKGSCRARNEAIQLCSGNYIIFGDDDVRLPADFVENHIRLLQTYNANACNGLDIRADHQHQNLNDLKTKLLIEDNKRWRVGVTNSFSNANSCVKAEFVHQLVGNDINYDGGYGEDSDFGISLSKIGVAVLHNPFSVNLHLKPPVGGYRFWGNQAKITGKKRKSQPWELDHPVKNIVPVPSPTVLYQVLKQYNSEQLEEYKNKYFFNYLVRGRWFQLPIKIIKLPYKIIQFNSSLEYAKRLIKLGKRTK
jgi:glycosyltransferase involved in cell wall biosynthesis